MGVVLLGLPRRCKIRRATRPKKAIPPTRGFPCVSEPPSDRSPAPEDGAVLDRDHLTTPISALGASRNDRSYSGCIQDAPITFSPGEIAADSFPGRIKAGKLSVLGVDAVGGGGRVLPWIAVESQPQVDTLARENRSAREQVLGARLFSKTQEADRDLPVIESRPRDAGSPGRAVSRAARHHL
ncbi:hypothetical protein BT67DRAFT_51031 [Trichocladium antarcticum]|uniref:Uncharacterized protein n=1 Tax=Trichocladium antarcticum TaxID=1450529 RepID=A0AAN6ZCQ5_9PEZI|nr:hypothetical protein BT67DRAFT_51031 [Trichocladium antarcticum]